MLALIIPALFATTALSYVGSRILAPEFGLDVPDFSTWLWFHTLVTLPTYILSGMIKEIVGND